MAQLVRLLARRCLRIAPLAGVSAAPFVPDDDAVCSSGCPRRATRRSPRLKKLRRARARTRRTISRVATRIARRAIDAARATGDPRYLGQAQAALAPWWSAADAPAPALLLRATIKQSQHDFDGALADLDRLLDRASDDAQARLTRATVRGVVGRHADARPTATALEAALPSLVAAAVPRRIRRRTADAARGAALDARSRGRDVRRRRIRAWALTLAGGNGRAPRRRGGGRSAFPRALALDPARCRTSPARTPIAARPRARRRRRARCSRATTRNDALLLRLRARRSAAARARASATPRDRAELAARFDATRRRGDRRASARGGALRAGGRGRSGAGAGARARELRRSRRSPPTTRDALAATRPRARRQRRPWNRPLGGA